jgi:transposase-like protein
MISLKAETPVFLINWNTNITQQRKITVDGSPVNAARFRNLNSTQASSSAKQQLLHRDQAFSPIRESRGHARSSAQVSRRV